MKEISVGFTIGTPGSLDPGMHFGLEVKWLKILRIQPETCFKYINVFVSHSDLCVLCFGTPLYTTTEIQFISLAVTVRGSYFRIVEIHMAVGFKWSCYEADLTISFYVRYAVACFLTVC